MKSGVYEIVNEVENKRYIGSTERDLKERKMSHFSQLRRGVHHNFMVQRDWDRLGEFAFVFNHLHITPPEYAKKLEQWYLIHFPGEYNISKIVEGRPNLKLTKEICDDIINDYLSEKYRQKDLSKKYKCSTYTINRIISGRSYLDYKPDIKKINKCKELAAKRKRGDEIRKTSFEIIGKIKYLMNFDFKLKDVAKVLNISTTTIHHYRKKNYMNVDSIIDLELVKLLKK